jgi:hypothetical protein
MGYIVWHLFVLFLQVLLLGTTLSGENLRMNKHTLKERAQFYSDAFPKFPPLRTDDRWLDGVWVLGNDYKNKTRYYGTYPPQYLKRIVTLFPDATDVLHLFSGAMEPGKYTRFDIRSEMFPDVLGNAEELSTHFSEGQFDLIFADPPYSQEDADHYGTGLVHRNVVFKECAKVLKKGGHLVWLDQVLPQFSKSQFHWYGLIAVQRSTNHRIRGVYLFERV